MTSKLLFAFLFLALLTLVVDAQEKKKPDTTNDIDECIKKYQCAPNDDNCRSACAGVPDPERDVAIETHKCYEECYNKHLPKDIPAYKDCTNDCKTKVYQEGVTTPGSPAPSGAGSNDAKETSSDDSKDSDNKESSDGDAEETDGKGDDKKDGSGASLSSKSVLVYVFAAVLACAAFTAGL